jgi:hypothetical protein
MRAMSGAYLLIIVSSSVIEENMSKGNREKIKRSGKGGLHLYLKAAETFAIMGWLRYFCGS